MTEGRLAIGPQPGTVAVAIRLYRRIEEPAPTASAKRRRRAARRLLNELLQAMTKAQRVAYYTAVQGA